MDVTVSPPLHRDDSHPVLYLPGLEGRGLTRNSMKSTDIRNDLMGTLTKILESRKDVEIQLDGKTVGILSINSPHGGTPPMRIRTADATKNWSELLNFVFIMGAKYFFKIRPNEDAEAINIYLFRPSNSRNKWHASWKQHKLDHMQAVPVTQEAFLEAVEELRENLVVEIKCDLDKIQESMTKSLQQIDQKLRHSFAGLNRPNGDLLATPEMGLIPLRTAKDLERYEVD